MDAREISGGAAIETLRELDRRGYDLTPKVRVEVHEHRVGGHPITYVDRLLVSGGPGALEETLREMVRRQKPYLLAAACVRLPPVQWLEIMVARCRNGHAPLPALAANLAGLLGKDPVEYGPRLEAIIEEALKGG